MSQSLLVDAPTLAALEHELGMKEVQINRLLNITQAINENRPAGELFEMYASFLNWELGFSRMALYFRRDGKWICSSHIGLTPAERERDVSGAFAAFTSRGRVGDCGDALLRTFDFVIPVTHKDEQLVYVFLGDLSDVPEASARVQLVTTITHVVAVAIENKRLFREQIERERYRVELALASDIQRSLVPTRLPRAGAFAMAALYQPRFGVGGDFYSAEVFDDGRLLFCVADISGKGTGAALLMSNFEASFWTLARSRTSLAAFVQDLNQALVRVTRGERFLTLFVGELDPESRHLTYVNAGHNPPLVLAPDGTVGELTTGCTFLGAFDRIPRVDTGHYDLRAGGVLLCYTDGVTELANPAGEMFGEERLEAFAAAHVGLSALGLCDALDATLKDFQAEAEPTDDITVLSIGVELLSAGDA